MHHFFKKNQKQILTKQIKHGSLATKHFNIINLRVKIKMRLLALDLGDEWTGVAVSDPTATLCKPLVTLKTCDLATEFCALLIEYGVGTVIYGMPLDQRGALGRQAEKTQNLVNFLKETVSKREFYNIDFIAWDERRSSKLAMLAIREQRKNAPKILEHAVAAAFILQNYLDFQQQEQERVLEE